MLVSFETVSHQIGDQRLDACENQDACFVETVSHQIGDQRLDACENQDACFVETVSHQIGDQRLECLREPRCLFHSKPSVIRLGTNGWNACENQDACFIRNRQSSDWGPKAGMLARTKMLVSLKPSGNGRKDDGLAPTLLSSNVFTPFEMPGNGED
ncbi:hypothetical protein BX666DRAFT_2033439 [Dichotomocladium elegans]|nr:hypothetical protein BX666DRAFT_2033439 [Dichotomocladium elegans]